MASRVSTCGIPPLMRSRICFTISTDFTTKVFQPPLCLGRFLSMHGTMRRTLQKLAGSLALGVIGLGLTSCAADGGSYAKAQKTPSVHLPALDFAALGT